MLEGIPPSLAGTLAPPTSFTSLRPPQPQPSLSAFRSMGRARTVSARVRSASERMAMPTFPRDVIAWRRASSTARAVEDAAGVDRCICWLFCGGADLAACACGRPPAVLADGLVTLWALAGRAEGVARPLRAWARRRARACRLPSDILGVIACAMGKLSLDYRFRYPAIASARAEHHELGALRLRVVVVAHQADVVIGIRPMAGFDFRHHRAQIGLADEGQLPHLPVVVVRLGRMLVLHRRGPAVGQDVGDLIIDLVLGHGGKEGEGFERFLGPVVVECLIIDCHDVLALNVGCRYGARVRPRPAWPPYRTRT